MAIRINQNLVSLLIQRNLDRVGGRLETAFERLSSGERIQRAGDDPSGLSTSQQIRADVRGLQRNVQNVSSAFNFLGSAETAIQSIQEMAQRLRELTVQAANDTLSPSDRSTIDQEIQQILGEINRTAGDSQYLGQKLLDGSVNQRTIQVGTQSGNTFALTLGDMRTNALGQVAQATSSAGPSSAPITPGALFINGVEIPASVSDGVSAAFANASILAKANAINAVEGSTGVRAEALPTEFLSPASSISSAFIDGVNTQLTINGVSIGPVAVTAGDADGSLVEAINAKSNASGVTAEIDADGNLKLTAEDGRNITVATSGAIADDLGLSEDNGDINLTTFGKIKLTSNQPFALSGNTSLIGLNSSQTSVGFDPGTSIVNIDVSTAEAASQSLELIDASLAQINSARSNIGALQNRLDNLTANLERQIEELSAADSRIRDADFALETARLTQAQILQEAATSLLAQANIQPRTALALLQRR